MLAAVFASCLPFMKRDLSLTDLIEEESERRGDIIVETTDLSENSGKLILND